MEYPLNLSFKVLAFAPQVYVTDNSGTGLFYVKQKLFKLKEAVNVFRDASQSEQLYSINADRVLDFNANYHIKDMNETEIGSIRRKGMRSLFRAHYQIFSNGDHVMTIREEAPWKRIVEALLSEIPLVGFVAVMLINPSYIVTRGGDEGDGEQVYRLTKKPAFFEGKFVIDKLADVSDEEEKRTLLSLLMMVMLERRRG